MSNYDPFFTNHWSHSQPRRHPYYYHAPSPQPVHHHAQPGHQYPQPVHQYPSRKPSSSAPKVVRIPVQFVNSEKPSQHVLPARSKSGSAVTIQKVFRGFLVRERLKKIKAIKKEVEDIEKQVSRSDYVELLKGNEKERLKVNEMLMGLLFKLDSIHGCGSGVRDCRKAVIKKAIALQERVDALIAERIDQTDDSVSVEVRNEESEEYSGERREYSIGVGVENEGSEPLRNGETEDIRRNGKEDGDGFDESGAENGKEKECVEREEDVEMSDTKCECEAEDDKVDMQGKVGEEEAGDQKAEAQEDEGEEEEQEGCDGRKEFIAMSDAEWESEAEDEKIEMQGKVVEEQAGDEKPDVREEEEEEKGQGMGSVDVVKDEKNGDDSGAKEGEEGGRRDEKERSTELLLERMMDENARMMSLMTQLFERNEMQTQMLNSLTLRVEQLEKAFLCDRMRRKKKRHGA